MRNRLLTALCFFCFSAASTLVLAQNPTPPTLKKPTLVVPKPVPKLKNTPTKAPTPTLKPTKSEPKKTPPTPKKPAPQTPTLKPTPKKPTPKKPAPKKPAPKKPVVPLKLSKPGPSKKPTRPKSSTTITRLGPMKSRLVKGVVSVELELKAKGKIYLGEILSWTAKVTTPQGYRVKPHREPALAPFKRLGKIVTSQPKKQGKLSLTTITMRVLVLRTGQRILPGVRLFIETDKGLIQELFTPRIPVKVKRYLAHKNNPELKPPADPVPIDQRNTLLIWTLIIGGTLLAGGLISFILIKLFAKPKEVVIQLPPPRPAHEIALEKLQQIRADRLIEKGEIEQFSLRVSETFREYLGNRWGFDSLEMTTAELLDELRKYDIAILPLAHFETFLYQCDLVKFAKMVPTHQEMEDLLISARSTVERTMSTIVHSPSAEKPAGPIAESRG